MQNIYVPIFGIPLEGEPEEWPKIINKSMEGIKSGKYKPSYIKASDDPTVAALIKPKIDEDRSIYWAWKIFLEPYFDS